jgi:hypothetical protein
MIEAFFIILFLILTVVAIWQLFALVGDMAERRGQDRLLWQFTALFINPVGAMLLLWFFCDLKEPDR